MERIIIVVLIGYLLDLCFGDPYWLPHPIRWMGRYISFLEKRIRKKEDTPSKQYKKGCLVACIVILSSTCLSILLLWSAYSIHVVVGLVVESLICYQMLATKCLRVESMKVYEALTKEGTEKARHAVSMIVGRDTKQLDDTGIIKATIETVAENTSDGVIGPLFYMLMGGAPLAVCYKAVNTLDSMIGYRSDKYLYFGRFAAKFDDVVNYIPARVSAGVMILAAWLLGYDGKSAYSIYKRDRYNHKSPNSAHTEAVAAGALGIQLAGDAYYFGQKHKKPTIGDPVQSIEVEMIKKMNKLMVMTSFLSLVIGLLVREVIR